MVRILVIAIITLALIHGFTNSNMVHGIKKLQNDRTEQLASI